ncbi:MAG TPA: hypothetical protein VD790_00360 [Thermoleophilaceae bacterium]|nr:hypothetical protein [Thermoleophilaceae bacterium]
MLLPAVLAGALVVGCGGDDDAATESATELLDIAFANSIDSADITLDIELELEGAAELEEPVQITLTGPYHSDPDGALPAVDWNVTIQAQGQSFEAGLTSTGDRAFIGLQGTDYEVSRETVENLNRQLLASRETEGDRDLEDFGVTPRDWVVDAEVEGDEEVADVLTTHVSGNLDVARILDDLNTVVAEASQLGGAIAEQAPPTLSDEQQEQIEDVVSDPRFDAYVGKDDERLHRLSADLGFEVPEDARERVGGLESGVISFSIEFANIGAAQEVSAPENARPVSELTTQLEGLFGGGAVAPPAPPEAAPETESEQQELYEDCVRALPDDQTSEAFCEPLLE